MAASISARAVLVPEYDRRVRFKTKLWRYPGPGGWTFALVPDRHAPPPTEAWGRTPVLARVDGRSWETSVWRDRNHGTLLPVPRRLRGDKDDGDTVEVELLPPGPRVPGQRPAKRRPTKT
jgi:hypothetical protein